MKFPHPSEHVLPEDIPLTPPSNILQNKDVDRFMGSLVGLATGDALGASVEFRPHQYFVDRPVRDMEGGGTWGLKSGQWTDDTSMALCLASSLISKRGYDPYDQLVRYKWWYKYGYLSSTGHCFDIGNATRDSLEEFINRQKPLTKLFHYSENELDNLSWDEIQSVTKFDINCSTDGVAGNGALMRLAPVPLFFYQHPEIAVEYAGRSGRLTHGDKKAVDACRYYAALIVAAVTGESKEAILSCDFYKSHSQWFGSDKLHPEVLRVAQGSYQNHKGYEGGIRGKGYIINALEAALWAFWSDNNSFEKGALAAVNLGDDTDTTAAIYGQLAGAYYGYKKLPPQWLKHVHARKLLECIGQWLYFEGERYKPTEREIKMISSGQSSNITSQTQHQGLSTCKLPTHFSKDSSSRTPQFGNEQSRTDRPGVNDVIIHDQDFSPTKNYQSSDKTVLSYQQSGRLTSNYSPDDDNSRRRQRDAKQPSAYQPDAYRPLLDQTGSTQRRTYQENPNQSSFSRIDNSQELDYQSGRKQLSAPRSNVDHLAMHPTRQTSVKQDYNNHIYGAGQTRILSPRPAYHWTNEDNYRHRTTVQLHHPTEHSYLPNDVHSTTNTPVVNRSYIPSSSSPYSYSFPSDTTYSSAYNSTRSYNKR